MSTLLELADRCEKATGPDRELDCEIVVAVGGGEIVWKQANYTMEAYPAHRVPSANHLGGFANEPVPAFSASLDAAMQLVPDPAKPWCLDYEAPGVWIADFTCFASGPDNGAEISLYVRAATPALALCAAALRARAQESGE
jgi:hypothetical protein